jgi:ribosome-associated translation inhibitor RaiA/cold shock CspA family protein
MPDGIVQWFDSDSGEGRVLHRRRRYAVGTADVEPDARAAGARVHFDIDHASDGTRATNVTLRHGTRSARSQRRFGDLIGATTQAAKTSPIDAQQSPDLTRDPVAVAEWWAQNLAAGDLDEVLVLYSPEAALHLPGQSDDDVLVGREQIRRHWHASPLLGGPPAALIRGEGDDRVVMRWPAAIAGGDLAETRLQVRRGEIVEQWQGHVQPVDTGGEEDALPLELSVAGRVSDAQRQRAIDRVSRVLEKVDRPVLHIRIRLENAVGEAQGQQATASAVLDIDGDLLRAMAVVDDLDAAIDSLEGRLQHQVERLRTRRLTEQRRGAETPEGGWRHGDLPADRPDHHPRPVEERRVVRHKTFTTVDATVDEAVFDLELMDYDFFLFTDLATGQEACVGRADDGRYTLQAQDGHAAEVLEGATATAVEVEVIADPAPELDLAQARERLDVGVEPWVFHTDAETGRGRVLYRRYDGHYGLITPR